MGVLAVTTSVCGIAIPNPAVAATGHRYLWHGPGHKNATDTPFYAHPPKSLKGLPAAPVAKATPAPAATAPIAKPLSILAGSSSGTAAAIVADLAAVLDDNALNITPATIKGAAPSLLKAADLPSVDLVLAPSDALAANPRDAKSIAEKYTVIARLFDAEVQLVAAGAITDIHQLDGKKIAVDGDHSYAEDSARLLFGKLGVKPQFIDMDDAKALDQLKQGKVAAVLCIEGKPDPELAHFDAGTTHLVSIPYDAALQDIYYPARLTADDYPGLIPSGGSIDTIAVGTLLLATDAPDNSPRYSKLAQFTEAFFEKFDALRQQGRHPKWLDVNLAAATPGWRRFAPAQAWLDKADATATVQDPAPAATTDPGPNAAAKVTAPSPTAHN